MTEQASETKYLDFLDGLRAVSILSVVLYHVGIPGLSGGFVGVDVFFVLSGFLIIGQIRTSLQKGNFSLTDFYARRTLRIIPPYLLVLVVSILIAHFVLVTPPEIRSFGESVVWSALMIVNHLFLSQQGYFDTSADLKPLLNLWSLSVEEQFYLVVPIVLLAIRFLGGGAWLKIAVALVGVVSFAGCVYFSDAEFNYAFYLTPLRGWEFIVGGAIPLAVAYASGLPRIAVHLSAYVGLALIIGAVLLLDETFVYPSYYALAPVAGTFLVVLSGILSRDSLPIRLLATKPLIGIGLISYSWYLWHWPLLSFGRIYNFNQSTLTFDLAMGVLSLVLAVATYFCLERPIRERRKFLPSGWQPVSIVAGLAAAISLSAGAWFATPVLADSARAGLTRDIWPKVTRRTGREREDPCFVRFRSMDIDDDCLATTKGKTLSLLVGDSHAEMLYLTMRRRTGDNDIGMVTEYANGCRPFLVDNPSGLCASFFEKATENLEEKLPAFEFAVISARWNNEIYGNGWQRSDDHRLEEVGRSKRVAELISKTLQKLRADGVKRFIVVAPVPEFPLEAPTCIVRAAAYGKTRDVCSVARSTVNDRREMALQALKTATDGEDDVRLIDPVEVFCDDTVCRSYNDAGTLYKDDHHISRDGSDLLYAHFRKDFRWLIGVTKKSATTASSRDGTIDKANDLPD